MQVGVVLMLTVFVHWPGTPFKVVMSVMVKLPVVAAALIFTVCPVFIPAIPASPVTFHK